MKLKEFEGKMLFKKVGIPISQGQLIQSAKDILPFDSEKVFKLQVVSNGRAKAGGVFFVQNDTVAREKVKKFLGSEFLGETVVDILLDEKVDIHKELYLGILFDTTKRVPVFLFSEQGGVDVEELDVESDGMQSLDIDVLKGLSDANIDSLLVGSDLPEEIISSLRDIMKKLWDCFVRFDLRMVEINPLAVARSEDGSLELVAVDSVVVLDEDANFRREIQFSKRLDSRQKTERELLANSIDENDPKGVAGKTYFDLDGDIAILTSGGGASMTIMDTLISLGGKPANFTEYSGDPSREKVQSLTRVVLSKPNLSGLLVGGAIANFTNIKETLAGIADVLIEEKPNFPIVIRRAGPFDQEAKEMLMQVTQEHGLDIHYFDETVAMTKAAQVIVELSKSYKEKSIRKVEIDSETVGGAL